MARRLILVDQSIKAPGGHHYEYAKRILDAAGQQGFDTLLLTHKDYRGSVAHKVRPAFSLTFWDNYQHYYHGSPTRQFQFLQGVPNRLQRCLDGFRLELKRRLIFSGFGLAGARVRHLRLQDVALQPHVDDDFSLLPSSRLALLSAWCARAIVTRARSTLYAARTSPLLRGLLKVIAAVVAAPFVLLALGIMWMRWRDPAQVFAGEFRKAMDDDAGPADDAIVFVPNATAAELDGLALLSEGGHASAAAHWAFLWRRPIFSGYPESYKGQMEVLRPRRMEFARLRARAPHVNAHFYTDTDELTEQCNLLGVYSFATLPVPVDPVPASPARQSDILTLGYLGDARDEKGFQHLPKLVEAFVPRRGETQRVRFLCQANFNVPDGEPGSRYARGILMQYDQTLVELVHGPFDSDEYGALLRRMDIVLIPYAAESYSARSSGILMEALAAGLPVLAPAGSWMARIAETSRRGYLHALFDGYEPVSRFSDYNGKISNKISNVDPRATCVVLRLGFDAAFAGYVRVKVRVLNEFGIQIETRQVISKAENGRVEVAIRKRPSSQFQWSVRSIQGNVQLRPDEAELSFYTLDESVPLDDGIVLYDGPDEIVRATQDLVKFYTHHKRAAERLRDELRPFYDPAVLVEALEHDAFGRDAAQMARKGPIG